MDLPEPTNIAGAIGIIGGAIASGWAFYQTRRENRREENIIITSQQKRIDELVAELREETTRADAFAKERNDLVREFSDVKSELAGLKVEMQHMANNLRFVTEQSAKQAQENSDLRAQISAYLAKEKTQP
jgi:uncharacterized coiled-coil DUF342 family protein